MTALTSIAFYLGVIAYSVAATLYFLELLRRDSVSLLAQWAPRVLGAGALFHATHIVVASLLTRVCPVESVHFALSLSALVAVGVYLLVNGRSKLHAMGAVVAPLALTFLVGAQFVGRDPSAVIPFSRSLLALHIAANVLG